MNINFSTQSYIPKTCNKVLSDKLEAFFSENAALVERVTTSNKPDFIEAIECERFIYVSCYVKTKCDYDYKVLYEPGLYSELSKSKSQAFEEDDYLSSFNRGFKDYSEAGKNYYNLFAGFGNGIVILDIEKQSIIDIFFFKDTYNMDCPVEILDIVNLSIVVRFAEFNYVFKDGKYTYLNFVSSYKHRCFGHYWINFPYYGYDQACSWELIDLSNQVVIPIVNIQPTTEDLYAEEHHEVEYDYLLGKFIFTLAENRKTAFSLSELIQKSTKE